MRHLCERKKETYMRMERTMKMEQRSAKEE